MKAILFYFIGVKYSPQKDIRKLFFAIQQFQENIFVVLAKKIK
jgi:hypothetical protein